MTFRLHLAVMVKFSHKILRISNFYTDFNKLYIIKKKTKDIYLLSNKNNSTEDVSIQVGCISFNKQTLLDPSRNLEEAFARTENSSEEGLLSQNSRWSQNVLSFEGLHFLKVKGDKPICYPALTVRCFSISP